LHDDTIEHAAICGILAIVLTGLIATPSFAADSGGKPMLAVLDIELSGDLVFYICPTALIVSDVVLAHSCSR
jgi:hypothetical protein